MDEPFTALDVQTRQRMQDFLLDVWRDTSHRRGRGACRSRRCVYSPAREDQDDRAIDLPLPRNLFSTECARLRIELTPHLRDEVNRAFAEQEAFAIPA
jgi:NitT/TauT family transport system ATP-binding protein